MKSPGEAPAGPGWPPGFRRQTLPLAAGSLALIQGGQGPPVVLVHGLAGQGMDFSHLAPLLAPHLRLIIPDLLGFGASAKPGASYDLTWQAENLAQMANLLDLPPCPWLGHSMGGLLVLRLALAHPELVTRMAAVCPAGGHVRPRLAHLIRLRLLFDARGRLRGFHPALVRPWVGHIFKDHRHPGVAQVSRRTIAQWEGPQSRALQTSSWRASRAVLADPVWSHLSGLARPVLLVSGGRDPVIPAREVERLWLSLPPGPHRWLRLPGGHMIPYTHAWALAGNWLDFLEVGRAEAPCAETRHFYPL